MGHPNGHILRILRNLEVRGRKDQTRILSSEVTVETLIVDKFARNPE